MECVRMTPLAPAEAAQPPVNERPLKRTSGVAGEGAAQYTPVGLAPFFNDRVTAIFGAGRFLSPRSTFESHLRRRAAAGGGKVTLPSGVPFMTPGKPDAHNIVYPSQWDNYPRSVRIPLGGRARHLYLLMAGQPITCRASSTTART